MAYPFKAVPVSDRIYWVGAIDWSMRDFHGYSTQRGSTYNAFLIMAEKVTLVDTVKGPFFNEMMARIQSVIDPSEIDYVISNHTEMDHSGSLPQTVSAVQPEKVFASKMGVQALSKHFDVGLNVTPVADAGTLALGGCSVTFLETRMLHWPDSMFTYLNEDKVLFSSDAFGMHLASEKRFADEEPDWILRWEAAKYFANILLLYSPLILKLVDKVTKLGLEFDMICPDHGPIWRQDVLTPVRWYAEWAAQESTDKAVIVYDTMWGSTEKMARAIEEGLIEGGARVKVISMKADKRADVATEVLDAGALIVGSPTLNNCVFPTIADVMTYLKGLKPKNLVGTAFGSYGWSGESVKDLHAMLETMGVDIVAEPLSVNYVPDQVAHEQCRALGLDIAGTLKGRLPTC